MRTPAFVATAAGILASIAAFAQGPVYSVNIVGFQKVGVDAGQFVLSSNPFVKPAQTVQDIVGAQLTGGTDFSTGDNMLLWNGSFYNQLFLVNLDGDPLDGQWVDETFTPSTELLAPGTGFWIINRNATNTFTMVGDVVMDATKTRQINPGFNLISYPYSTSAGVNSSALNLKKASGCQGGTDFSTGDNIFLWNGSFYNQLFLVDLPGDPLDDQWVDETFTPVSVDLQPGQGFWYLRNGSGSFNWTTTKPY
jgi:hypothetical protein